MRAIPKPYVPCEPNAIAPGPSNACTTNANIQNTTIQNIGYSRHVHDDLQIVMHGHQARKRFGQNFLADTSYVRRIIDAVAPLPGDNLVEIGPGLAAITGGLIARAGHINAIEIDRDLAARLRTTFTPAQLTLHEADALTFDYASLGAQLRVVGNLPYNISSPLLFLLAAHDAQLRDLHVMLRRKWSRA